MLRDGEEEGRYAYGVQRYESESSQETDRHRGQPDVHGGRDIPGIREVIRQRRLCAGCRLGGRRADDPACDG